MTKDKVKKKKGNVEDWRGILRVDLDWMLKMENYLLEKCGEKCKFFF
jgi:hypothetical protein